MNNETTTKTPVFQLFDVRCKTAAGTVGDWTVVAVSADMAIMSVSRRLLQYFGRGLVLKLPTSAEISATLVLEPAADILLNPGLRTENVTFPARTFSRVF